MKIQLQVALTLLLAFSAGASVQAADWLVDPSSFKARVSEDRVKHELVLENGLARRVFQLAPNAACVSLENLTTQEHLLRAVAPEARVTINNTDFAIGGLTGAPIANYLKAAWREQLTAIANSYQFTGWKEEAMLPRFAWKKRLEWMARDLPWPPPGKHIVMTYAPPPAHGKVVTAGFPIVEVHYEIYDGIPLMSKWLVLKNGGKETVRVNRFTAETLRLTEAENSAQPEEHIPLHVETDFSFGGMSSRESNPAVKFVADPDYPTQQNYTCQTPCLLVVAPPQMGPDVDIKPGESFESFRVFELLLDSSERERRTLAQRRMYRTVAPWTTENPFMFHKTASDAKTVRVAIDQASEVGFDMVIMSFGSRFNFESRDPAYQAKYKELAAYGTSKGIALGGYSLLASRGASTSADNTQGQPARFGVMPCLGATWGHEYLAQIRAMCEQTGFGVLENDGSYPGDRCAAMDHPYHHGLADSQWVQWRGITGLYQWCTGHGVYLNIPDWYFLAGGTKTGMGYRETDWSLPRAEQEIIERQNMFDGTWDKTSSMGWMFVPLSQYHGGGAAATIEPLKDHLPHYDARFANLIGYGVQACYRGPRLYDTEDTKALVKKWVKFYKTHREVLDGDIIHLRRPNGQDWDGIVHVNPQGKEKALAFFYNPLAEKIVREIRVPLYYAGLVDYAQVSVEGGVPKTVALDRTGTATLKVTIPAHGRTWVVFTTGELMCKLEVGK